MRLLVTGGAGFIGSAFVRNALQGRLPDVEPSSLLVLDALTYAGTETNLTSVAGDPRLTFVEGDIRDGRLVRELVGVAGAPEVDAIVHFAAESHVDRSLSAAEEFVSTNVGGTTTLLQAALEAGVAKFVHISTDEVYGTIAQGSWREDHILEPNSPYSASKASSDLVARSFFRTHGLPVCITRCSNNYGPHQFPEKAIPRFVTNLLDGGTIPLYGDGRNVRDWLHVDDHCRGIALVLTRGRAGEIYNIGGGTELSNRQLVDRLLEILGADESVVVPVADRLGHDLRYSVDITKIADELGYAPQVDFAEGLAATVQWYRDNRHWWEPLKARVAQ
ncbi:dTDP-glucose 4,6-dehydratase [Rhodococcus sp. D2-41]|uniref:dTDP-glucose 4,6-dehydratase n=1 Tax=Speluncibacter jeojiensis TaxID=2710754 RepID=A0A9X4M216_9ACTN|nr:dTDP-glucose 4,6-dehydratase [Rhodococcus sp. D2-41]MDG3008815.1 dTDP-glucose 4,6-dehydratase [Rhodococcus sp. D2-41]MDG3012976.1 dTDP-glucose 4,6-dehydratase [Corynebacteriales bacterium D3-21]